MAYKRSALRKQAKTGDELAEMEKPKRKPAPIEHKSKSSKPAEVPAPVDIVKDDDEKIK